MVLKYTFFVLPGLLYEPCVLAQGPRHTAEPGLKLLHKSYAKKTPL